MCLYRSPRPAAPASPQSRFPLVSRSRIGLGFAAMDFRFRRGVSDEAYPSGVCEERTTSLNRKDMPPCGLRRSWLLASLLPCLPAGRSVTAPLRGMLLRRASPEANCGATNAHPIREWDTSPRELDLKPGTRGHGCPRSNLPSPEADDDFSTHKQIHLHSTARGRKFSGPARGSARSRL